MTLIIGIVCGKCNWTMAIRKQNEWLSKSKNTPVTRSDFQELSCKLKTQISTLSWALEITHLKLLGMKPSINEEPGEFGWCSPPNISSVRKNIKRRHEDYDHEYTFVLRRRMIDLLVYSDIESREYNPLSV